MKFTVDHDENIVIFTFKEPRLDSSTAPEVKAELLILCQPTISALVVDLSRVDYADSSGLSALLLAYRQLRDHKIPIALVGVRDTVRNLFRISQMEWLFEFYPTREAALEQLQMSSN
jgi:anti-anti-sigma factor